jgi:hypothetical protein
MNRQGYEQYFWELLKIQIRSQKKVGAYMEALVVRTRSASETVAIIDFYGYTGL